MNNKNNVPQCAHLSVHHYTNTFLDKTNSVVTQEFWRCNVCGKRFLPEVSNTKSFKRDLFTIIMFLFVVTALLVGVIDMSSGFITYFFNVISKAGCG